MPKENKKYNKIKEKKTPTIPRSAPNHHTGKKERDHKLRKEGTSSYPTKTISSLINSTQIHTYIHIYIYIFKCTKKINII
jgi:hypothetical protein